MGVRVGGGRCWAPNSSSLRRVGDAQHEEPFHPSTRLSSGAKVDAREVDQHG